MPDDKVTLCDFCHQERVIWQAEEMAFRQWSDKGYVHCLVELAVGTCGSCGSKSLQADSDGIFDAAFSEEYGKLP